MLMHTYLSCKETKSDNYYFVVFELPDQKKVKQYFMYDHILHFFLE